MNKAKLQKVLALRYNRENLGVLLEPYKDSLLAPALAYVDAWKAKEVNFAERPDLIEIKAAILQLDAESICWPLLTTVLLDTDITLQAAMGMFFNRIGKYVESPYRRGRVFEVYVAAILSTGLVEIKNMGKYLHLKATVSMGDQGQRNYGYTLPSVVAPRVKKNSNVGYNGLHAITGGSHKEHNGELCLDHIRRLNNVAYRVDERLLHLHQPTFDSNKKYKERLGRYEKPEEVEERRKAFELFKSELPTKIRIMLDNGNHFYFAHRYDTRLRTYLKAYHFDFIGNKYCRAFVQPIKGSVITGMEEYI